MKRICIFIFVLFLTGCSGKDYITCNIDINNKIENYKMTGVYKIYYDNNFVTKIEKKEKYISSDKSIIKYFDESKNLEYYNLFDLYNGYIYTIKSDDTTVNIDVEIDMNLLNLSKMVEDSRLDKDYVISNKLTTSGIVKFYESKGSICDI